MGDESRFRQLEDRVDSIDTRLTKVETSLTDMRGEVRAGFADLKAELLRVYDERSKWGQWARDNVGRALKWGGAIILAACGINQTATIARLIREGMQ